jgi:hypothetical protein
MPVSAPVIFLGIAAVAILIAGSSWLKKRRGK